MMEMIHESIDKQGMPYHGPVKGLISITDNKFRRNKGAHKYRERILAELEDLFVDVNVRMDSTAMRADYLLPAASHYEAWDLRSVGYHRFVNVFTASVDPVGEALPDWDIMAMLTKKIQERARARGAGAYEDGSVTRNLDVLPQPPRGRADDGAWLGALPVRRAEAAQQRHRDAAAAAGAGRRLGCNSETDPSRRPFTRKRYHVVGNVTSRRRCTRPLYP